MRKNVYKLILVVALIGIAIFPNNVYAEELTDDDYAKLAEVIKEELKSGNLESEEDIRNVIDEARDNYDLEISETEEDKVVSVMNTVNKLGIDPDTMADMVDNVYDKVLDGKTYEDTDDIIDAIENEIIESATEKVEEVVKEKVHSSIGDYFKVFIERIKEFIERIKSMWMR